MPEKMRVNISVRPVRKCFVARSFRIFCHSNLRIRLKDSPGTYYSERKVTCQARFGRLCYIPNAVLSGEDACDCVGLMLEINKRKYCDPEGRPIPEKLAGIAEIIQKMIADCVSLDSMD